MRVNIQLFIAFQRTWGGTFLKGTVQYRRVNSYLSEIDITMVDGVSSTITGTVQYRRINSYLSEIDITVVDGVNSTITGTVRYRRINSYLS
jgi:hypothetical protein